METQNLDCAVTPVSKGSIRPWGAMTSVMCAQLERIAMRSLQDMLGRTTPRRAASVSYVPQVRTKADSNRQVVMHARKVANATAKAFVIQSRGTGTG